MNSWILYALVIAIDVWAAFSALRNASHALSPSPRWGRAALLFTVLLVHGVLWHQQVFTVEGMRFGFAPALSITFWLACVVLWLEGVTGHWSVLEVVAYPAAAVGLLLPVFFEGSLTGNYVDSWYFKAHLSIALAASGVVSLAAAHAVLMSLQERRLHRPVRAAGGGAVGPQDHSTDVMPNLLDRLPPLLAMERLLFKFISVGFFLLTLTILSGVLFTEQWLNKAMQFNHKTVFTVVSWAIFGALLLGRHLRGWRGKTALRWTMAGVATLLLAYVGSRFVLEVVLHKAL